MVALAVLLLAAGLAACGGGDDSTTPAEGAAGQPEGRSSNGGSPHGEAGNGGDGSEAGSGEGRRGGEGGGTGNASNFVPRQHEDSGGGAGQFTVKGGDNSVQEFGEEADPSEFDAAATALHNFLDARAEGSWAAACRYMAKPMIESFEESVSQAKRIEDRSCGGILAAITNPAAKSAMKAEAERADVGSLRIEGERAFLIYFGTEGTILAMPMADEGGAWKVASLSGTPLN
jgi:hypothetical protein